MSFGYMGKILIVNLSNGEISEESPGEEIYEKYLGGLGLGIYYLYKHLKYGIDPLGPENILGFLPGLLNGTNVPFSGRYTVVAKSPLTNSWGDANSGGFFGTELKKSGYDAIFFKGKSEKPVYFWLNDGKYELRDASHLWGKDTYETEEILQKELEIKGIRVACIGQTGENLSLISGIFNDKGRAAARSGLGAVMGSKKLKAIAVKGSKKVEIFDPERFKKTRKILLEPMALKTSKFTKIMGALFKPLTPWMLRKGLVAMSDVGMMVEGFREHGTAMLASASSEMGDSPCKNWKGVGSTDFPMKKMSYKISDDNVTKFKVKRFACQSCPLGCGAILDVNEGPYPLKESHRPEYETLAAFGSLILLDDVYALLKANDICNREGFDTISAGTTIAFAMECYEQGILTKEDTGGIELTWGNAEATIKILEKMVRNEKGIGEILANGVKIAAEKIGKDSEKYAMHILGEEIPMHDPRLNPSFGTTYITDPTPARHTQGGAGFLEFGMGMLPLQDIDLPKVEKYQYIGKGKPHKILANSTATLNALGICIFSTMFGQTPLVEIVEAVTGWKFANEKYLKTGERIQNLRLSFNIREGLKPSDFVLPERVRGNPPLTSGANANITIDIDSLRKDYFKEMNWNLNDGRPSKNKLEELDLNYVINDLY